MLINFFLLVSEGGALTIRKTRPAPRIGEIVIPLRVRIPASVFRPKIAEPIVIEVPEAHVIQPTVETFEVEPSASDASTTPPATP